jgi:two-component sensor histidine kinase
MALIHKKLYLSEDTRSIALADYLKELIDFLIYSYDYNTGSLKFNYDIPQITLDVDKAIPVGLIVNELVANSLKHGLPVTQTPELAVAGRIISDKEFVIQISDNGAGFSYEGHAGSEQSFGLKMVNLLLKDLGGTMKVFTDKRTIVEIKFPIK